MAQYDYDNDAVEKHGSWSCLKSQNDHPEICVEQNFLRYRPEYGDPFKTAPTVLEAKENKPSPAV